MNKWVIGGLASFFVLLLCAAFFGGKCLLTIEQNVRAYTIDGQVVDVKADWSENVVVFEGCNKNIIASSIDNDSFTVSVDVGSKCEQNNPSVEVAMLSMDLSQYESVVIRRASTPQIMGDQRYIGISSSLMGKEAVQYHTGMNPGTVISKQQELAPIYITNDGNSITVKSTEGTYLFDADKPLYFTNTVSTGVRAGSFSSRWSYSITGVEAVPLAKEKLPEHAQVAAAEDEAVDEADGDSGFTHIVAKSRSFCQ